MAPADESVSRRDRVSILSQRLRNISRAALSELATVRGEVVTALAIAGIVAVVLDDGVAVELGISAIVIATVAVLAFGATTRPSEEGQVASDVGLSPTDEVDRQRILIGKARLQEIASQLGLRSSPRADPAPSAIEAEPLVSVVVPCFNDERFVAEALASLRARKIIR